MKNLQIEDVKITLTNTNNGLIGFSNFILNKSLFIGDIAIYKRKNGNGIRLVYPRRKLNNGKDVPIFYPITKEMSDSIEIEVSKKINSIYSFSNYEKKEE